ncbi:MAG: PKD domain-containing protein [Planctomycetaceae bacterium]|nr:PKD domain-containing protein [Planctomycetaceae bacterium]
MIQRIFSLKFLLVAAFLWGSFSSSISAEIKISPDEPKVDSLNSFSIEADNIHSNTDVDWEFFIKEEDGSFKSHHKFNPTKELAEIEYGFNKPGSYRVNVKYTDKNNEVTTTEKLFFVEPLPVPAPPSTTVDDLRLELGLEHYVYKIVKENAQYKLLQYDNAPVAGNDKYSYMKGSFLLLSEYFAEKSKEAPQRSLSDENRSENVAYLNQLFQGAKDHLNNYKKQTWDLQVSLLNQNRTSQNGLEPYSIHPGEKYFNELLDNIHKDLKDRLFDSTSSVFRSSFSWSLAVKELSVGFTQLDKSYDEWLKQFISKYKSIYNPGTDTDGNGFYTGCIL